MARTDHSPDRRVAAVALLPAIALLLGADPAASAGASSGDVEKRGMVIADISISDAMVMEGDPGPPRQAIFTVSFQGIPFNEDIVLSYSTIPGSATPGLDYTPVIGGMVIIPQASTPVPASIVIDIPGDLVVELIDETFDVQIALVSGTTNILDDIGTGTIVDDDRNKPTLAIADVSLSEGNGGTTPATFDVTLSNFVFTNVSVDYQTIDASATGGTDYVVASGTLTFAPYETLRTITVDVVGDLLDESDETFQVLLSNPSAAATILDDTGIGTIVDDDLPPAISIADVSVGEGNAGITTADFQLSLSAPSSFSVSADFATADDTAGAGSDYQARNGTAFFAPGATTSSIQINVTGDTTFEPDETFFVNLSAPSNATISDAQGLGTIVNDDAPPGLSISDVTVVEGTGGATTATFDLTLSAASSQTVTVAVTTADGTATAGADYQPFNGSTSFAPGATSATLSVTVIADSVVEPDETFFVNLGNPVNATLTDAQGLGTILDDDAAPQLVQVRVDDVTVVEGDDGTVDAVFRLTGVPVPAAPVSLLYDTVDGTATAGLDYEAASGIAVFPAGQGSVTVTVPVLGDLLVEGNETFELRLSQPQGIFLRDHGATCTIEDDDEDRVDVPNLSIDDVELQEGDEGSRDAVFTVSLLPASTSAVTVEYRTADGSASQADDYQSRAGMLRFEPGETAQSVSVPILGDLMVEEDETFFVDLTSPSNAELEDARGQGTILNDDDQVELPRLFIDDVTVLEGNAGQTNAVFRVRLSRAADEDVSFDFGTEDGTATAADNDYAPRMDAATIAAGQTALEFNVGVIGDLVLEEDEWFWVRLRNPVGATLADELARGTIVNDDEPSEIFIAGTSNVGEGAGRSPVQVERSGGGGGPAQVTLRTGGGNAAPGVDYVELTAVLSWAAGEIGIKTASVEILEDRGFEVNETIGLRLTDVSGDATLGSPSSASITIFDNDMGVRLRLEGEGEITTEVGGIVPLEVTVLNEREEAVSGISVDWAIDGDGGELLDGAQVPTGAEGTSLQRVQAGTLPTRFTVVASLPGTDERGEFQILVEGNLRHLFDPDQEPVRREIAETIDRLCIDATGELAEICRSIFSLDPTEQRILVEELTPTEIAAQVNMAIESILQQIRNLVDHMRARRSGSSGTTSPVGQLSFQLRGESLGVGQLLAGLAHYRPARETIAAKVDGALALLPRSPDGGVDAGGAGDPERQEEPAPDDTVDVDAESRVGFFLNGTASFGDRPTTLRESGYDFETLGLTTGVDYRFSDRLFAGVALGYVDLNNDFNRDGGALDVAGYSLSLYSSYYVRSFYVDGVASFGSNDYDLVRNIDVPDGVGGRQRRSATSSTGGDHFSLHLGLGYDALLGKVTLGGFGRVTFIDLGVDSYVESGADVFDLAIAAQDVESMRSEAGLELTYPASFGWGILQPTLRLSWFHEFDDDSRIVQAQFVIDPLGEDFRLLTEPPDRDFFNLGLGLTFTFPRGRSLYMLYDTDLERDDLDLSTVNFGYRQSL